MAEPFLLILLFGFLMVIAAMVIVPVFFGAPWHPTSKRDIHRALEMCEPQADEVLYDLGSGDGRVLLEAVRNFRVRAIGIEIDPLKVLISRWRVAFSGMPDRIAILRKSVYAHDYKDADIIFIYMTHQALDRLFPAMLKQLKPSVRIVCFRFCLRGFRPEKVSANQKLFLYRLNKGQKLDGYS